MKRRVFLISTVALLLGGAAISVFTQKKKQEPVLHQIEYSNLTDTDTQTLLTDPFILENNALMDGWRKVVEMENQVIIGHIDFVAQYGYNIIRILLL